MKIKITSILMLVVLVLGIALTAYGITGQNIYGNAADAIGVSKKDAMTYIQDPSQLTEMGNDHSIIIFPEGGRGDGETIRPFKSGIYHLAKKNPELELVPIYLDNMNRILPRGVVLPVPMRSRVIFGSPIWIENAYVNKTDGTVWKQGEPLPPDEAADYEFKLEPKDEFLRRCRDAVMDLKDM